MVFPLKPMGFSQAAHGSDGSHDGGQSAVHPVRPGDDSEVGFDGRVRRGIDQGMTWESWDGRRLDMDRYYLLNWDIYDKF